jgi:hypothetical protein
VKGLFGHTLKINEDYGEKKDNDKHHCLVHALPGWEGARGREIGGGGGG